MPQELGTAGSGDNDCKVEGIGGSGFTLLGAWFREASGVAR